MPISTSPPRFDLSCKRLMDIAGSTLAIILLSPVLVLVAICVRLLTGSPILFRQVRPGLHSKPFILYKFRTMNHGIDSEGNPLPDAQRLTPLGRFLRSTSLDELPQFFNVIKGEMSLVGPRPLRMEYLPLYTPEQARRHEVRPGITGWAQVNGRNWLTWEEKFAMDVWYVDNQSLILDLRILCLTVRQALTREGISAPGHSAMPPFAGSGNPENNHDG
jgi:sugar transferase EpsL